MQREEHLHGQTLVPQPTVAALDGAVLDRPARPDEVEVDSVAVGPSAQQVNKESWAKKLKADGPSRVEKKTGRLLFPFSLSLES